MKESPPNILILDDDPAYCEAMSSYLEAHGCAASVIHDPAELDAVLAAGATDLLLLDQRLGRTTGTDVLLRMREVTSLPCIVVTGQSDAVDRIVNLEIGADDEVEKTIPPREMLARIRTVLRRTRALAKGAPPQPMPPRSEAATGSGWQLSRARRDLRRPDGTSCRLTTAEFDALQLLLDSAHVPVQRATLSEKVFGRPLTPEDRAVDTVIRKLRVKIDPECGHEVIKTVRHLGYMFTGFPDDAPP